MIQPKVTANEFTNVRNISDIFLYTKDNYIFCYLKIYPVNIDLLSRQEKKGKTDLLAKSFESDRTAFAYMSYPREVDLDTYKQHKKKIYDKYFNDYGRRHILSLAIRQAKELETNGENYDHQHYLKIWRPISSHPKDDEKNLRNRIIDFQQRYMYAGIETEILHADEIIKMCNLFANSTQAPFENPSGTIYEPLLIM